MRSKALPVKEQFVGGWKRSDDTQVYFKGTDRKGG